VVRERTGRPEHARRGLLHNVLLYGTQAGGVVQGAKLGGLAVWAASQCPPKGNQNAGGAQGSAQDVSQGRGLPRQQAGVLPAACARGSCARLHRVSEAAGGAWVVVLMDAACQPAAAAGQLPPQAGAAPHANHLCALGHHCPGKAHTHAHKKRACPQQRTPRPLPPARWLCTLGLLPALPPLPLPPPHPHAPAPPHPTTATATMCPPWSRSYSPGSRG